MKTCFIISATAFFAYFQNFYVKKKSVTFDLYPFASTASENFLLLEYLFVWYFCCVYSNWHCQKTNKMVFIVCLHLWQISITIMFCLETNEMIDDHESHSNSGNWGYWQYDQNQSSSQSSVTPGACFTKFVIYKFKISQICICYIWMW